MKQTPLKRKSGLKRSAGPRVSSSKSTTGGKGKQTFPCVDCGQLLQRVKVGGGRCRRCSSIHNVSKRTYERTGETLVCEACAKEFYATPSDVARGRRFCSNACDGAAHRVPKFGVCTICGVEFPAGLGGGRVVRKTCSPACHRAVRRRSKLGARNPQFTSGVTQKREAWKQAGGSCCQRCGSSDRLHSHHVVYKQHVKREAGEVFDTRNALRLCFSCHMSHHHSADKRLPVSVLRAENVAFAIELLGPAAHDYFIRYYDVDVDLGILERDAA